KNIITVIQAIKELQNKGYNISHQNIKEGLLHVVKNTGLMGRWQTLGTHPKVVCDTGHNRDGLNYVMKQLSNEVFDALHIVFGVVNDKDLTSIIDLLPKHATYYFCKPDIPRGLDAKELKSVLNGYGLKGEAYNSVNEAYNNALEKASLNDFIFIGGSTFVVAEII
ncbi:MAG TPA: bifunctional folylpolyglutamate synthase/dihydrofolate synthase, partial [Mariniflexile sp.]